MNNDDSIADIGGQKETSRSEFNRNVSAKRKPCPTCGVSNFANDVLCKNCGSNLDIKQEKPAFEPRNAVKQKSD